MVKTIDYTDLNLSQKQSGCRAILAYWTLVLAEIGNAMAEKGTNERDFINDLPEEKLDAMLDTLAGDAYSEGVAIAIDTIYDEHRAAIDEKYR